MKLLTLSCNECGAPLEVPAEAKYVTCGYCSARLAVQRTSNAVYTEVLEKIGEQTEKLAQDVEILKLQNELERLDREWSDQREQYMVRDKHGNKNTPSAAASLIGALVAAGAGVFWMVLTASSGAPGFFPLFGFVFIVVAIIIGATGAAKASAYKESLEKYERRRMELIARLNAQTRGDILSATPES
jgi:DNA-directed RNA polymerase subunit RPC12/RpoP